MIQCSYHACNKQVPIEQSVQGDNCRRFCSETCKADWKRQNDLLTFAAQGGPVWGGSPRRAPRREKKWWTR